MTDGDANFKLYADQVLQELVTLDVTVSVSVAQALIISDSNISQVYKQKTNKVTMNDYVRKRRICET